MRFTWNERKHQANIAKHDVDFELASEIFDDPFHLSMPDEFNIHEERWLALGATRDFVLLLVVHTENDEVIHIISARPATNYERRLYENNRR